MCNQLSLLKYCKECGAKCCITKEFFGTPILSEEEVSRIQKFTDKGCFTKVISPVDETYYIIQEQEGTKRCAFLTEENLCFIQAVKPLDCLCYPVKAIWKADLIMFVIDEQCPAASHRTVEFTLKAVKMACKSLRRFDAETYEHWLVNHIGWLEKATPLPFISGDVIVIVNSEEAIERIAERIAKGGLFP